MNIYNVNQSEAVKIKTELAELMSHSVEQGLSCAPSLHPG
jgi:hypothetical protein